MDSILNHFSKATSEFEIGAHMLKIWPKMTLGLLEKKTSKRKLLRLKKNLKNANKGQSLTSHWKAR